MSISFAGRWVDELGGRVGRGPAGSADGSDRPHQMLPAVQRRAMADGAELGHAVSLHHATTDAVGDGVAEILVQRCRARQHRAQCRQVVVVHQRMLGQRHRHRRRDIGHGHLVVLDIGEELLEIEARHHHQPRPRMQDRVEQHRHSVDVEERHDRDDDIVGLHVLHRAGLGDVGDQVAMCEHHALWDCPSCPSCRAARPDGSRGRSRPRGGAAPESRRSAALGWPSAPSSTTS